MRIYLFIYFFVRSFRHLCTFNMPMYLRVYIRVCIAIFAPSTCICICAHTYVYRYFCTFNMHMYLCTYVCVSLFLQELHSSICTHVCVYACVHAFHMYVCMHARMHMILKCSFRVYVCTCVCVCMYVCMYEYTSISLKDSAFFTTVLRTGST